MIASMKVKLPSRFTDTHLTIPDENLVQVLRPKAEPIGTGPLAEVVGDGRGKRVCLIIEDLTRSAPIGRVLPRLQTTFTVITHGGYLLPLLPENSQ